MAALDYSPRTLPLFESGDLEQGLVVALEQLTEARRNPADQQAILHHLEEVAEFSIRLGHYEQAIDARQEMLARYTMLAENRPSKQQSVELSRLGYYFHMGNFAEAEEYLQRAAECAMQLPPEERQELPVIFINRCHVAWKQKNLGQAKEYLLEAWRLQNRYSPRLDNDFSLMRNYAMLLFDMGDTTKAKKTCDAALRTFDTPDLPKHLYANLSSLYALLGKLHEKVGEPATALAAFWRAADLLTQIPRRHPLAEERAKTVCAAEIARLERLIAV